MASQKSAPVGRLEAILDDFTEVHGSVLLGMHKEIQTLKEEIQKSVDTQIGALLAKIRKADGDLAKSIKKAQRTLAEHKTTTQANIASFESASAQAQKEFTSASKQARTVADQLNGYIVTARTIIEDSVASEMQKLKAVIETHQATLSRDVKAATTGIENVVSSGNNAIRSQIDDFQSRVNASLSFTNQINKETQAMLDELRAKEAQLRKLTLRLFWIFGPTVLATLGVWIWLVVR